MLKNLGEWNQDTDEVSNPRFQLLMRGTEHVIYLDGDNVLKTYFGKAAETEEELESIANHIIEIRNSVSEQIPISLEGYVTHFGILYPVFKQEKLETVNGITYNLLIKDLKDRLANKGWKPVKDSNLFYNEELDEFLEDMTVENVGIKDGKLYMFDGYVYKGKKANP